MALNIPVYLEEWLRGIWRDPKQFFQDRSFHQCPCCDHEGHFVSAGRNGTRAFRCPNCASRPRDRQIALIIKERGIDLEGKNIIHFAPEWPLFRALRHNPNYVGGDIIKRRNANAIVDMTDIKFADNHFDFLICNHVLEHIPDDTKAMREAFRVMKPGARALFSVPIKLDRPDTWEPPANMSPADVEKACGWDHKRLYGRVGFAQSLESVGFSVESLMYAEEDRNRHRLFEEPIYLAAKPAN